MATTVPQAGTSTPVSTAAKRPAKTQTFLTSLRAALSIFDDKIATLTDVCDSLRNFRNGLQGSLHQNLAKNRRSGYHNHITLSEGH